MTEARLALTWARRELRGGIRGFRIFLACLTLGVAAIAAIGSLSSAILAGLARDGAAILGGDVAVRQIHLDLDDAQKAWIEARGTVAKTATMRSMARADGRDARSLIELKAVDSAYPLYGTLDLQPALANAALFGLRDGAWGAAADDTLLRRLGLTLGQRLKVGDAEFEIRSAITNEPDRSSGRFLAIGPRFMISFDALRETRLVRPGSQVWYVYGVKLAPGADIARWTNDLKAAFPDAAWTVRDRSNASPALKRFIDRMTMFMTLVGLTTLLIGGVGVGNAVRNYLGGKTEAIATLKCVGTPGRVIFLTYLIQILAMAAIGIAAGLAIGAVLPYAVSGALAGSLPIDLRFSFYPLPLVLAAVYGLLVALAFSVWPIARACDLPAGALFRDIVTPGARWPRPVYVGLTAAAVVLLIVLALATAYEFHLALWFVAGALGAMVVFRLAAAGAMWAARKSGRQRNTGLRLALANLHRPGSPTPSVVMSLGLGLTVLVAIALIEGNLRHQIADTLPEKAPGFYFIDIQPDQISAFAAAVLKADPTATLKRVPMLRGRITALNGAEPDAETVAPGGRWVVRGDRGLTWAAEMPEDTRVVAGKWWPANYSGPPLVSMSAEEAGELGLKIGDTITVSILGRDLSATIANLRQVEWGTLRMNFVLVFSPGLIEKAPQTYLATVQAAESAELAIERAIADGFPNVTAIRVKDVLVTINDLVGKIGLAIRFTAAVTIVAGVLVLAGAIAAGHRRRVYDSVILKVLGATRQRILGGFLIEYGLLGLTTAVIAAIAGTAAAWGVVTGIMAFDWVFLPGAVAVTALASVAIVLGLGFLGTWRALGQKSAPLLRNA